MYRRFMPLLCALVALPALAAAPQWGGSITASSDYLQHGTSRNYNDPALAAELHAQLDSGLFASLWASSSRLRYVAATSAELALTAGYNRRFDQDWSWTASFTHYAAPWSVYEAGYRYDELSMDLDWREHLLLSVSWSPDTSRYAPGYGLVGKRRATAWEVSYQQELHRDLRAYAGIGYYDLSALFGSGYWYGSVGLGRTWRRWQLDMSYVLPGKAARRLSYPETARRRVVASLAFIF
jgi:uncharacterized protein (TIGR02001 family)